MHCYGLLVVGARFGLFAGKHREAVLMHIAVKFYHSTWFVTRIAVVGARFGLLVGKHQKVVLMHIAVKFYHIIA